MKITPLTPVDCIDWNQVELMKVTLEKPWGRTGGLRFRLGTNNPRRNLDFDPRKKGSLPYYPGTPLMYPADAPAIAGSDHDSFIMPASISRQTTARDREGHPIPIPDPRGHSAFVAFGFFMAPREESFDLPGLTISSERTRVAHFWNWFKMPPGDGTMFPPMNLIGPPDVPHVALRPMTVDMQTIKVDGEEVVIRPREFWDFDNIERYDAVAMAEADKDLRTVVEGLTHDEILALRELVKRGKTPAK